jgi:dephospho-CoA kinase
VIKVAITGGIGCGKSIVCQVFSTLKVPIYYTDVAAGLLSETDTEIRQQLIALLGDHIYVGQSLNKPLMTELIFSNKWLLEKVNQIVHPKVAKHFQDWCTNHSHYPYVIEESALLFESNAYLAFDKIITVTAPEALRIQRVLSRKHMTLEKIKAIMENQWPEQEKIARSFRIIVNDGLQLVIPQVLQLHQLFMAQS